MCRDFSCLPEVRQNSNRCPMNTLFCALDCIHFSSTALNNPLTVFSFFLVFSPWHLFEVKLSERQPFDSCSSFNFSTTNSLVYPLALWMKKSSTVRRRRTVSKLPTFFHELRHTSSLTTSTITIRIDGVWTASEQIQYHTHHSLMGMSYWKSIKNGVRCKKSSKIKNATCCCITPLHHLAHRTI